ncbi:MAG: ABC transporter ATP-binding protein [Deltaproteobacteria bacterium]|nr:ABC transporter ATP-binding protein [Deltaproteobacteria bacterium]
MESNAAPEVLRLSEVTKTYRQVRSFFGGTKRVVTALNRVSFSIAKGEIFGLIGESGSGKSTVGRLIVKLETPDSGEVFLDQREITGLRGRRLNAFRSRVQMIFQDPYQSLNPQLSVFEAVEEPLVIHTKGNRDERKQQVFAMLDSVRLSPPEDFGNRFPHQLSGGQRQRVAIARAMVLNPELMVADEPTSMLDAPISIQIFDILLDLQKRFDVTFLFISHSLAAAHYLCDRIAVIYRGNLVELGEGRAVITQPRHPYTQALMDALPRFAHGENRPRYNTLLKAPKEDPEPSGCPFYPRCARSKDPVCRAQNPGLKQIENGHTAACFLV